MQLIRQNVRRVIYAFGALIIALLLFRFVFKLLGLADVGLIAFLYDATDVLVNPFSGLGIDYSNYGSTVEWTAFIALLLWLAIILLVTELITAFLYDNFGDIVINLVDIFFKTIEFFLLFRLVTRVLGISSSSSNSLFNSISNMAGVFHEVLAGSGGEIELGAGGIELSTLVVLIIVIVMDAVIGGILKAAFDKEPEANTTSPQLK